MKEGLDFTGRVPRRHVISCKKEQESSQHHLEAFKTCNSCFEMLTQKYVLQSKLLTKYQDDMERLKKASELKAAKASFCKLN